MVSRSENLYIIFDEPSDHHCEASKLHWKLFITRLQKYNCIAQCVAIITAGNVYK